MTFTATIDRDADGTWVTECRADPGSVSLGQTRDEALANVKEAIAAGLEVGAPRRMPLTVETEQVVVVA